MADSVGRPDSHVRVITTEEIVATENDVDGVEHGDVEFESNQVDVINISSGTVRFEIDGSRYVLKTGQVVSLHKSYALARQIQKNKDPIPSVVELLTSKMVLAVTDPRARHMVTAMRK